MKEILVVKDLRKSYGSHEAVKGISFDIRPREIFALIGPNGAGKTTTLRTIATLLKPGGGDVEVMGISVKKDPEKVREIISYLPEEAGAYKSMTGIDYLNFMAAMYASDSAVQKEYTDRAVEICGLGDRLKEKVAAYSKGMTRKLMLSRAVMTRPKLAILDEPTSGLDVLNAIEIRKTIKELASQGMTVLISSHNMLEIEFLSDRVAIMDKGLIHGTGTPSELKKSFNAQNLEEVFVEVAK